MDTQLTFENLPALIGELVTEVRTLRDKVEGTAPMDAQDVATYLKTNRNDVYVMARQGKIPNHRKGRKLYFFKEEVDAWVRQGGRRTKKAGA